MKSTKKGIRIVINFTIGTSVTVEEVFQNCFQMYKRLSYLQFHWK